MSRNLTIDGRTLNGVSALKATDADTGDLVSFVDTSDATAERGDITAGKSAYVNGVKLNGTNTGMAPNDLDGIVDGSIEIFNMPSGKTKVAQYRFYQMTGLEYVNLGAAEVIEQYAFDGCTAVSEMVLPKTLLNIGAYAFRNVGTATSLSLTIETESPCDIGTYAFNGSRITAVRGKLGAVGSYAFASGTALAEIDLTDCGNVDTYAFQSNATLTKVKLKINGSLGNYAFYNNVNVNEVEIDPESNITSLGTYVFSQFGCGRANASQNIITLDLRNSKFNTINSYAFGGSSATTNLRNQYMQIHLPKSVATVSANAFRYTDHCDFYFHREMPPTLSATTCWADATNYRIFVPFKAINAYKTATNWVAYENLIKGFAVANTFEQGATLPEYNAEGYALTWYSDKDCKNPVTTVEDAGAEYYCLAGTEKEVFGIMGISAVDCKVVITDGARNYVVGEGVRAGTRLTITAIPSVEGYVPYMFKVNGEDFESGDSFEVDRDISVTAIYYDGESIPVNPVFADNEWNIILSAFLDGKALELWQPGDMKEFEGNDGNTYHLRIADMNAGRYDLVGGGKNHGVLEFVESMPTTKTINSTQKEGAYTGGGFAMSDMLNTHLKEIYETVLPEEIKAIISEVSMSEYSYTEPTPRAYTAKLFLPAETEVFAARHYSAEGQTVNGISYPQYAQFDYYAAIPTADGSTCPERQKTRIGTTSSYYWWLRSPYSGNAYNFCNVYSYGNYDYYSANSACGVSPCFAI